MLVDSDTLAQRSASSEVIPRVKADRGLVKHELFESIVELNSGVCTSPEEALDVVRALRRATTKAAGEIGCTIAAAGSHPTDIATRTEDRRGPALPRFRRVRRPDREAAGRAGTTCPRRHARRGDMPSRPRAVHFVAARDPCAVGELAMVRGGAHLGLLSTRAEILGLLPRHGAPPRFESWADWEHVVGRFVDAGVVPGYGGIHWDIRPHPKFGTLEVRMPDQPTDVRRTGAFATLVHALAAWALENRRRPPPRAIAPSSCRTAGPHLASALARSSSPSATARP